MRSICVYIDGDMWRGGNSLHSKWFQRQCFGWSISSDVAKLACNKLTALLAQFGSGKTTSFIEFQHATRPSEPHNISCSGLFLKEAFRARPPRMEPQPCEIPKVLCCVIRCCVILGHLRLGGWVFFFFFLHLFLLCNGLILSATRKSLN